MINITTDLKSSANNQLFLGTKNCRLSEAWNKLKSIHRVLSPDGHHLSPYHQNHNFFSNMNPSPISPIRSPLPTVRQIEEQRRQLGFYSPPSPAFSYQSKPFAYSGTQAHPLRHPLSPNTHFSNSTFNPPMEPHKQFNKRPQGISPPVFQYQRPSASMPPKSFFKASSHGSTLNQNSHSMISSGSGSPPTEQSRIHHQSESNNRPFHNYQHSRTESNSSGTSSSSSYGYYEEYDTSCSDSQTHRRNISSSPPSSATSSSSGFSPSKYNELMKEFTNRGKIGKTYKKHKSDKKDRRFNHGRWTREEHALFVKAFQVCGRDWSRISREFVTTRMRSQVASHAQKYLMKMESDKNGLDDENMDMYD